MDIFHEITSFVPMIPAGSGRMPFCPFLTFHDKTLQCKLYLIAPGMAIIFRQYFPRQKMEFLPFSATASLPCPQKKPSPAQWPVTASFL
jgi:hypothetical protein